MLDSPVRSFRHEALFYAGADEFVDRVAGFIRDGLAAGEPVLTVVGATKLARLRRAVGADSARAMFADMAAVGGNPSRIIPAWQEFVADHGGRRVRGVGEPIWAARGRAELAECQRHESLLNVAFAGAPAWWLVCPYDTTTLAPEVVVEARRSHPFVSLGNGSELSPEYRGLELSAAPYDKPLDEPEGEISRTAFTASSLGALRRVIARHAALAGIAAARVPDLVLAANEIATNSVRHGGGSGVARVWCEPDSVVCEIRDAGRIREPMVGRKRPVSDRDGRGLWLVHQLCDLVELRSFPSETVVRLHMRLRPLTAPSRA